LRYLELSGRPEWLIRLVEAYTKEQGLYHTETTPAATYSDTMELDLAKVEPSLAGPTRPQDRVRLSETKSSFANALKALLRKAKPIAAPSTERARRDIAGRKALDPVAALADPVPAGPAENLHHGSVVIAAITSCTNTSNPSVMVAAGLLAKKAV